MKTNELGQFIKVEKNFIGHKKYQLIVIKKIRQRKGNEKAERWYLECLCDCGNKTTILQYAFEKGRIQSCGWFLLTNNANGKEFGESSHNTQYANYKRAAEQRNLEFLLTKEEFKINYK